MFGMARKPRGLFQFPEMQGTPPIMGPRAQAEPMLAATQSAPQRKGLFGRLGVSGDQVYALGALLQGNNEAVGQYHAMRQQPLLDAQKRETEFGDWKRRFDYEAANKPPTSNDTVADYQFILRTLGPEKAQEFLQNKANPPVWRQGPDGQFYRMDVGDRPAVGAVIPDPRRAGGAATPAQPPFDGNRLDHITMMSESGGNPNAVSSAGARGLMQVMPATARDPGFGIRPSNGTQEDDGRVGREYRAAMQRRYGNDPAKMWAAYNAGPGRVDSAIAQGGDWLRRLPAETQNYVARNLRALGVR